MDMYIIIHLECIHALNIINVAKQYKLSDTLQHISYSYSIMETHYYYYKPISPYSCDIVLQYNYRNRFTAVQNSLVKTST